VYHARVMILDNGNARGTKVRRLEQCVSRLVKGDSEALDHGAHEHQAS
jgi:hypothetical protein